MDVRRVEEGIGLVVPSDRNYIAYYQAGIELEAVEATFEQIFHPLEAGVLTVASGTADGAGSGKIYDYTFPTTAAQAIKTYTIEAGDNNQEEEITYCFCQQFNLSGSQREPVMMRSNWIGRQVSASTFTGSLTAPTVEEIIFSKGKLYINNDSSAFGTTVKANTLLAFDFNLNTGWIPKYSADGNLYFGFAAYVGMSAELSLTFEHDATSVAEKAAWRAKTARAVQLKFEGSALTSAATYTYKTLIINLAGKWHNFDKIGEVDGNDIVTGTLIGGYNATLATMGNILLVNEVATVP
jgi:hypothetical protein